MADPFLGEIRLMPFGFAPKNWAQCNGQILAIQTNSALFSLLGTTYGGNGTTTFALPDLRGRAPLHSGSGHFLGELAGEPTHTLSINEIPQHSHTIRAASLPATSTSPSGNVFAAHRGGYADAANATMAPNALGGGVGSQAHENRPPFLVLNFCICTAGIYPTRD